MFLKVSLINVVSITIRSCVEKRCISTQSHGPFVLAVSTHLIVIEEGDVGIIVESFR